MGVYIEYVFIDNFVIDFLILKLTCLISRKNMRPAFFTLGAFSGGVFALIFPLISDIGFVTVFCKVIFGLLMVTAIGKFKSFKDYVFTAVIFFCITFATGGAVMCVYYVFNVPLYTELSVGLAIVPAYIVIKSLAAVLKKYKRNKISEKFSVKTEIIVNGVSVFCEGFFDTGNSLYDGLNPVIMIDEKLAAKFFDKVGKIPSFGRISVNTAVGSGKKLSIKNARVIIYYEDKRNIFNNVTVAIGDLSGSEFKAILHPALMEVKDVEIKSIKSVY